MSLSPHSRPQQFALSYWTDWFDPRRAAPGANHSTGLIAAGLHRLLAQRGSVQYFDNADRPSGLRADLFVGHFWAFAATMDANAFDRSIAVYVLSDPDKARQQLSQAAQRFNVPLPQWDLPPLDFNHQRTLALADVVLLCGNTATAATFPAQFQPKIRLFNYGLDEAFWQDGAADPADDSDQQGSAHDFVYVATHCGLRKGFLDLIATWREIPASMARCHVIGRLDPPYDLLLAEANTGSVVVHGWIDSRLPRYRQLLRSCPFAYLPTWVEGQMGTLLETLFAGCIPLTTVACGVDDDVLQHCELIEPLQPEAHRARIEEVLGWSDRRRRERRTELRAALRRRHSWTVFDEQVGRAFDEILPSTAAGPSKGGAPC